MCLALPAINVHVYHMMYHMTCPPPPTHRVVTGGQNGRIKVWNYNNGQCVHVLEQGNDSEVTDIKFISVNSNK